jgi:hypothetical protein
MRSTTYSISFINDRKNLTKGGIVILTGGFFQTSPKEYMVKTIGLFTQSDVLKQRFRGTNINRNNHFVFIEEHLDNPYLWLVAWGIENDELYSDKQIGNLHFQELKTSDNGIVILKGGFNSHTPKAYMDLVVSEIVKHQSYNEFIESNLKNPYYRIIVFDINGLQQHKFSYAQQYS